MKTAQVSIELIIVVGLLTIVLFFLIGLTATKKIETAKEEAYLNQHNQCLRLSSLILETYVSGNGTTMLDKIAFNATILPSSRSIEVFNKESVYCTIPINRISSVTLNKGLIEIKNVGDFVDVSNK